MGQLVARHLLNATNDTGCNHNLPNEHDYRNVRGSRPAHSWYLPNISKRRMTSRQRSNLRHKIGTLDEFPDLHLLPPEIALKVLQNLNATDLCLASCVWADLANDERLWEGLCKTSWGYCTAYKMWKAEQKSFKKLYLLLDEGSLTFNAEPEWGIKYLKENNVLCDDAVDIALFFHGTNLLCWQKVRLYMKKRTDVLEEIVMLQSYKNQFLPNALRKFFHAVDSPTTIGDYLNLLIDKFATRFCNDNPHISLTPDIVAILCYSLILLSVDLASPQVKNKMSKREFIRNICTAVGEHIRIDNANLRGPALNQNDNAVDNLQPNITEAEARRRAIATVDRDFAGHLYDNIYLVGHVAPQRWED